MGVLTGVFLSFIGYLGTLSDPAAVVPESETTVQPEVEEVQKPRFDFYTKLKEETVEVAEIQETVEPAADVSKPPAATGLPQPYLLQAGSFRQREDAERRRAELLLLGLEPNIEETNGANGRWFRVNLGPFESREHMSRARGLTANQNIDTLLLKRSGH
jgi:cell division protein FtsN